MRIVRFAAPECEPCLGVLDPQGDVILELNGDPLGDHSVGSAMARLDAVTLLAPCVPTKIVCVAINFSGIDGFDPAIREPLVFIKPPSSVTNPGVTVQSPFPDHDWWGEAELGVVIKRRVGPLHPLDPKEAVLGFTIGNDTTVANIGGRDHHLGRSKAPDGFCALGPWIETELLTDDIVIEAIQDGEVIRRGRTSEQIWQWPQIIREVSRWMTLEPWDVVLTGNPPDTVGMRFLGPDTVYTARVEGIGEITNRFVA